VFLTLNKEMLPTADFKTDTGTDNKAFLLNDLYCPDGKKPKIQCTFCVSLIDFKKEKRCIVLPLMISRLLTRKGELAPRPMRISLNA
jgi:hypothetical protein